MDTSAAASGPVVCLAGPTASGKTDLAMALVERFPLEIISVDSAMVYRGMDIGTAKPGAAELARAPHRLIDILDPEEAYSAARFCADAEREMADIRRAGRIPLLVGGTMLYYRALSQGLSELPAADAALRQRLGAEMQAEGCNALHRRLAAVDPVAAGRIHPNDPQRILRALEVWELTGQPLSRLQNRDPGVDRLQALWLALLPADRAELHRRIELRFRAMLSAGFIDEVRALMQRPGLSLELPSMRAVGYRQVWQYLTGELCYDAMLQRGISATRQLAKRQMTWLRSLRRLSPIDMQEDSLAAAAGRIRTYLEGWAAQAGQ